MKVTRLVSQEKPNDVIVQQNNEDGDYIQINWCCVYEVTKSNGGKFRFVMDVPRGVEPEQLIGFEIKTPSGGEVEVELEKHLTEHGLSIGTVKGEEDG
jgi:hypothetical protein